MLSNGSIRSDYDYRVEQWGACLRVGIDAGPMMVRYSGISRYTDQLLRAFARIDTSNEYVLYGLDGGIQGRVPTTNAKDFGPRFSRDARRVPQIHKLDRGMLLGKSANLDLFHGTNYWAPLIRNFPSVLTIHDLTVHLLPENHPRTRRLAHALLPVHCRSAKRIIADSLNTKRDLQRHYKIPPERIDVIHLAAGDEFHPVSREEDLQPVRQRYGLPDDFMFFVGAIEPRKNIPLLVRALYWLRRDGLTLPLVIAGNGKEEYVASLHRLVEHLNLELGKDVIILGNVANVDLPALYSLCELFVYPSQYEGFGLPPLEALACGTPVVVPNNSSFGEIYTGCATFASLDSPQTLAEAISKALAPSSATNELVDRGMKLAHSRSWDDTAAETLDVYRRAGGRRPLSSTRRLPAAHVPSGPRSA